MTVNAVRLNHAVLFVANLERSLAFYQGALDVVVVAREPRANAAFLRLPRSRNHHDLGLFGVGAQQPRPPGSLGLYHLAWQVDTIEELDEARLTLANLGALTGESSHGATKSVYAQDPDGNEFEVMWMLPKAQWGDYENAAPVERLDLAGEVTRWGGVRTAGELVPLDRRDHVRGGFAWFANRGIGRPSPQASLGHPVAWRSRRYRLSACLALAGSISR